MSTFQAAGEENLGEQRFAGKSQSLTSFHGSSFFFLVVAFPLVFMVAAFFLFSGSFPTSFHGGSLFFLFPTSLMVVAFSLVFMVVDFPLVFMELSFLF